MQIPASVSGLRAFSTNWPVWALAAAVFALVLVLARESLASMFALWQLSSYQHAWLIPFISAFMLWMVKDNVADVRPQPSVLAGLVFIGTVWAWVVARLALVQGAEHLSVWLMLNAGLCFVLGIAAYRRVMAPFLYLFFALPIGTFVIGPLMEITATISGSLLSTFGIPAYRAGMFFTLSGGSFEVADVCAGYNYLNAGLCVSALFAYLMFRSPIVGALYVAAFSVVVVLINGVRAAIVMAVASATDMRYLADDHILFGWVLFLIGMVGMYYVGFKFSDKDVERAKP